MRVDPQKFTESQWVELFNATGLIPPFASSGKCSEDRNDAEPFEASVADIYHAAALCREKAIAVLEGHYGPSETCEDCNDRWAADLLGAASALRQIVAGLEGGCVFFRCIGCGRLESDCVEDPCQGVIEETNAN